MDTCREQGRQVRLVWFLNELLLPKIHVASGLYLLNPMECIFETLQMAKTYGDVSGTGRTTLANSLFELSPLPKIHVV